MFRFGDVLFTTLLVPVWFVKNKITSVAPKVMYDSGVRKKKTCEASLYHRQIVCKADHLDLSC